MKIWMFVVTTLLILLLSGCRGSSETINSNTTTSLRDTTAQPPTIKDSSVSRDDGLISWLYGLLRDKQLWIDSAKWAPRDTVKIIERLKANPLKIHQSESRVTPHGDSVDITYNYLNGLGKLIWDIVPGPLTFQIQDTHTESDTVKQYDKTLLEKIWDAIKDFALVISLFVNVILAGFIFLSKIKIPFTGG